MLDKLQLTERERLLILHLASEQELSIEQLIRRALIVYQTVETLRKENPEAYTSFFSVLQSDSPGCGILE